MGVCVCIRTHTHTMYVGCTKVSPGVGTRHLESLKNTYGLNLGISAAYMYSYTCIKYICVFICCAAGWDHGLVFFSFNVLFLPKKKSKRCGRITENSNPQWLELHRPSIKGTKLPYEVTKVIIIILIAYFKLITVRTLIFGRSGSGRHGQEFGFGKTAGTGLSV